MVPVIVALTKELLVNSHWGVQCVGRETESKVAVGPVVVPKAVLPFRCTMHECLCDI